MKVRATPKKHGASVEVRTGAEGLPAIPPPDVSLKRILVPTDFSESSRKAMHYAEAFARQFNAEILLLHVVERIAPPPPSVALMIPESIDAEMLEHAAKRLAEWRRTLTGLTVKANVRSGTPYYEIVRAAEETNTDLIVLSTHGRTGLAHVFIGSNAERVVRHAPCPVLVVRQREHDFLSAADSGTATSTNRLKGAHYGNRTQKK